MSFVTFNGGNTRDLAINTNKTLCRRLFFIIRMQCQCHFVKNLFLDILDQYMIITEKSFLFLWITLDNGSELRVFGLTRDHVVVHSNMTINYQYSCYCCFQSAFTREIIECCTAAKLINVTWGDSDRISGLDSINKK